MLGLLLYVFFFSFLLSLSLSLKPQIHAGKHTRNIGVGVSCQKTLFTSMVFPPVSQHAGEGRNFLCWGRRVGRGLVDGDGQENQAAGERVWKR